jgi:hypothetical protein
MKMDAYVMRCQFHQYVVHDSHYHFLLVSKVGSRRCVWHLGDDSCSHKRALVIALRPAALIISSVCVSVCHRQGLAYF